MRYLIGPLGKAGVKGIGDDGVEFRSVIDKSVLAKSKEDPDFKVIDLKLRTRFNPEENRWDPIKASNRVGE